MIYVNFCFTVQAYDFKLRDCSFREKPIKPEIIAMDGLRGTSLRAASLAHDYVVKEEGNEVHRDNINFSYYLLFC